MLCYHDLARPGYTGSWLKMDVKRFERQIGFLKMIGNYLRPGDLFESGRFASCRLNLLLTFDDGQVNNFKLGLPVLQRYSVPALFFISTWHMESGEPFWFDRLIRAIQHYRLSMLDLRRYGMGIYRFNQSGGEKRWAGINRFLNDIKESAEKHQDQVSNWIMRMLPGDEHLDKVFHKEDLPLNKEQILAMRNSGLCWFGSHSHRHRILTKLDDDTLLEELRYSRDNLENVIGQSVEHIAYPNGNVDTRVREACLRAGYRFGYTVDSGRVRSATDHLRIPRISIGGFDSIFRILISIARSLPKADPKT